MGDAPRTERVRLFVAVDVPDAMQAIADQAVSPLRERFPEGRWTNPESRHVTLKFLGWTPAHAVDAVGEVVGAVGRSHGSGQVSLGRIGGFPTLRRARVLWIGLDDPAGLLARLAGDLDRALEPLGYVPEARAFTPHLTLARFKVPVRLGKGAPEVGAAEPFEVEEVHLYRSRLHPSGARYEVLESFPLAERPC